MEDKIKELENEIIQALNDFLNSKNLPQALEIAEKIKSKLTELSKAYLEKGEEDLSEIINARTQAWEIYIRYMKAKMELFETGIADDRGQFNVDFIRGNMIIVNSKNKIGINPKNAILRLKICGAFLKLIREINTLTLELVNPIKTVYKIMLKNSEKSELIKETLPIVQNWFKSVLEWRVEALFIATIIAILKGDAHTFNQIVKKHLNLLSQLNALRVGYKHQPLNLLKEEVYGRIYGLLRSKYEMLITQRTGFFSRSVGSEIRFFMREGGDIKDISIPSFIQELSFKDLFPKAMEEDT
ncbi:MAG: hypothetical protein ACTSSJ_02920 [Candidatus Odinarchaeia archaeon]